MFSGSGFCAPAVVGCPVLVRISDNHDKFGRQPDMQRRNLMRLRRGWFGQYPEPAALNLDDYFGGSGQVLVSIACYK